MSSVVVGLDIGGTKIIVAAADQNGKIIKRERAPTPRTPSSGITLLHEMIADVTDGAPIAPIAAIAAAAGGPLNWQTGVISPLHQPDWHNIPLKSLMEAQYHCPFSVDVDTNLAALAEYHHAPEKVSKLLYLTVSTGLGGSLVAGGRLYRGMDGVHPEVGHDAAPFRSSAGHSVACACGSHGCLESLVSGNGIRRLYRKSPEDLSAQEWEEVSWNFGQGLRNLAVIYLPDLIVLGGGLIFGARDALLIPAIAVMRDHLKIVPHPRIVASDLGEHNVLAGAILLALRNAPEAPF